VIGAIYLDGGMENARAFIHRFILEGHEDRDLFLDSKSKLQEYVQGTLKQDVSYQIIGENGPEHNKTFLAAAVVGNDLLGKGEGKTKKAAEQQAAYNALLVLRDR
jgi:ribonuclease-3